MKVIESLELISETLIAEKKNLSDVTAMEDRLSDVSSSGKYAIDDTGEDAGIRIPLTDRTRGDKPHQPRRKHSRSPVRDDWATSEPAKIHDNTTKFAQSQSRGSSHSLPKPVDAQENQVPQLSQRGQVPVPQVGKVLQAQTGPAPARMRVAAAAVAGGTDVNATLNAGNKRSQMTASATASKVTETGSRKPPRG